MLLDGGTEIERRRRQVLASLGGVGFTPTGLSGLSLWLDATQLVGYADNDTVSTWPDLSGNSRDGTATGTPKYRTAVIQAKPAVEFITSGRRFDTPSFLSSALDTALSVYIVAKRAMTSATKVALSGSGVRLYLGDVSAAQTNAANTGQLSDTAVDSAKLQTYYIQGFRYDGSNKRHIVSSDVGRLSKTEAATGNLGLSGALAVGDLSTGSFTWDGQIAEVIVYGRSLTDQEEALIIGYLESKYDIARASSVVYFDGNSLTSGTGATSTATSYPGVLMAALGAGWRSVNYAQSGQTSAQRNTAKSTPFASQNFAPGSGNRIAVLWEVTNDLALNQDPTAAYNAYVSWCQAWQALGVQVVAVTCLPRSAAGLYANFEADRQTVNASIVANWGDFSDALADVAANTTIGEAGDSNNTTYYNPDKVHLTDAGYAIVAGIVQTAVESLL